ncbi:NUDIX domain-containing protein [Rhodococcus sp. 5A-K4]|uniref:NUDIX domain-containing protein n=1 Tax=Rhodococcus sp. 5A-K4 TaxID=3384442 RepID=UPI0038D507CB
MADQFALVPAVYVMFRRSNPAQRPEVLLQLREGTGFMDGYWAHAAAGHVELGESALDAAVREAAEELGVELLSSELKPLTVLHRRHAEGSTRWIIEWTSSTNAARGRVNHAGWSR